MAKGKSTTLSTQEWTCRRHGTQAPPGGSRKGKKATCRWCGDVLTLNTWTMSGG